MTRRHIVPTLPLWHASLLVLPLTERSVPVRLHPGSPIFCEQLQPTLLLLPRLFAPVRLLLCLPAARFTARATIGRSSQTR